MADIFQSRHAIELLQKKVVLLLGDSNMRSIYKDLILLISRNEMQTLKMLKYKGGESFEGLDRRTCFKGLIKGRDYEEGREFSFDMLVEYHFIARCYTPRIEEILRAIKSGERRAPDVIVMNSCLWDLSRWGPNGVDAYKDNMQKLMQLLKASLPDKTLFIWTTALPVSTHIRGGLLLKQLDFMQSLLRFEVMEANLFCRDLVVKYGYDVLDLHYYLRNQVHRRMDDGVHYGALPVRFNTNLILTHISLSWNVPLPGNFSGIALERIKKNGVLQTASEDVRLPEVPASLRNGENGVKKRQISPKKRGKYLKRSILGRGGPLDQLRDHSWGGHLPRWHNGHRPNRQNDHPAVWQRQNDYQKRLRPNDNQTNWQNDNSTNWQNDDVWNDIRGKPPQHPRYPSHMQPNDYWDDAPYPSQKIAQSNHANFDQVPVPGPVRRNNKFPTGRYRPYPKD